MGFLGDLLGAVVRTLLSPSVGMRIVTNDDPDDVDLSTALLGQPAPVTAAPPDATVTAQPPTAAQKVRQAIASLQAIDPDFSDLQFLAQATKQFGAFLAAENAMDASPLEGAATPSFIDCYRKQLSDWQAQGLAAVATGITLADPSILKVSLDGTMQLIQVRFTGSGVRCRKDAASGAAVDGSLQPGSFTEFATFVRPAGATTPKTAAAGAATHCPSCGAPVDAGAIKCPYCGTQITGTGGTWLLDHTSISAYT
jgi:predicted lipid-binding transport protein (Tim44 family)